MLIDTHCHINMMVKKTFDTPLTNDDCQKAHEIVVTAQRAGVTTILNVGTSLIESTNCIILAQKNATCFASVGIHPNDCTQNWKSDLHEIKKFVTNTAKNKIIAIGECGIDKHYPDYNLQRQQDAFRAQIELALTHDLALVVHTRDAGEETLKCLHEFKDAKLRGVIHCFSENLAFAQEAMALGFVLGIGGTVTYPKNQALREIVQTIGLEHIILETDAPFLPPQAFRGKQNHPAHIRTIAEFSAELLNVPFEEVANITTRNAHKMFGFLGK